MLIIKSLIISFCNTELSCVIEQIPILAQAQQNTARFWLQALTIAKLMLEHLKKKQFLGDTTELPWKEKISNSNF